MKLGVLELVCERVDGILKEFFLIFDTLFRVRHFVKHLPFQVSVPYVDNT